MRLEQYTLLYRGIDAPPETLSPVKVLKTNTCERILWCVTSRTIAKTYIPNWGLLSYCTLGWNDDDIPRPDDNVISSLMETIAGPLEIHQREWPLHKASQPENIPQRLIANNTFGRPTSWKQNNRCTWGDIRKYLSHLGYTIGTDRRVKLKTRCRKDNFDEVMPANATLRGSLVTFQCKEPLNGTDLSSGDLLDPDYHHAAKWAKACTTDFFAINDYCQTELHGNLAHTSYAILPSSLPKLEVISISEASHPIDPLNNY